MTGEVKVLELLGQRSSDALIRLLRVLLIPTDVHVQRVVVLCVTNDLVLPAPLQGQSRSNIDGDTRRLWGQEEVKL